METRKFTPSAPVAPALWPTTRSIRPAKRRFPNTVDEPRNIGYYLKPLLDITKRPDRDEILKAYLRKPMYNNKKQPLCFSNQFIR